MNARFDLMNKLKDDLKRRLIDTINDEKTHRILLSKIIIQVNLNIIATLQTSFLLGPDQVDGGKRADPLHEEGHSLGRVDQGRMCVRIPEADQARMCS